MSVRIRTALALLALLLPMLGALPAGAVECGKRNFEGVRFSVCEVALPEEDLRLFQTDADGRPWGQFDRLDEALAEDDKRLAFAMNGGMYHTDRAPVGHLVVDGDERMRLITNPGPGNFGMLPNGVFCLGDDRAWVMETLRFEKAALECRQASQSGPMLVIEGKLHPKFNRDSSSRLIRNGVGVSPDGRRAVFVMSDSSVNFHQFARLFRDELGTPNALYIDGNVSRLYAPSMGRYDLGPEMGPIVGVVEQAGQETAASD